MPEEKTITIQNGGRLKEWFVFDGSIISLIVAGTVAWVTLCSKVDNLDVRTEAINAQGTKLSQTHSLDIIQIKADVGYTRMAVDNLDRKLEKISERLP